MSTLSRGKEVVKRVAPDYYDRGLEYKKIRLKTDEGKYYFSKYNVRGTPTIILTDDDGNEKKRIVGAPSESSLRASIEKVLGTKKSLFGKIFGR